jgi:hypothetical protein
MAKLYGSGHKEERILVDIRLDELQGLPEGDWNFDSIVNWEVPGGKDADGNNLMNIPGMTVRLNRFVPVSE